MDLKVITIEDLQLNIPFRLTVSGPSGSGKTNWIYKFLKYREILTGVKFDTILYAYGETQPIFDDIKELCPDIIWCEGFDHEMIIDKLKNPDYNKLLIIDDLLHEVCKDKMFHTFYVRRSHHWNVSIIFTTQYLHEKGLRLVNLNTTHYILFKSFRDLTPVRTLALQIFPHNWRKFMKIYTHVTK